MKERNGSEKELRKGNNRSGEKRNKEKIERILIEREKKTKNIKYKCENKLEKRKEYENDEKRKG